VNGPEAFSVGASATITYNASDLCTTDADGHGLSAIWDMLDGAFTNRANGYAQVGYWKTALATTETFFSQYIDCFNCGHTPVTRIGASAGTQTHNYKTLYDSTNQQEVMYVDSIVMDRTNFNPVQLWNGPFDEQYLAETHDRGDDMPGTAGAHAQITNASRQSLTNGNGPPPYFTAIPFGWRYHDNQLSGTAVDVWTDPLT
jgi:hypothetical protein